MAEHYFDGIKHVIQITPSDVERCKTCNYSPTDFADTINHYLTNHGYKLLHAGTQSSLHYTGDLVHDVTVLLGK